MISAPPSLHTFRGAGELTDRIYFNSDPASPDTESAYLEAQANARIWQAAFDRVTGRELERMNWADVRLLIFAYEEACK